MGEHNAGNEGLFLDIKSKVPKPTLIFEIGAYDGDDIVQIQNIWPGAIIHAFEPEPDNFIELKKREASDVICNQLALSNSTGTSTFHQVLDARVADPLQRHWWFKTAGSLHPVGDVTRSINSTVVDNSITVNVTTVDAYCDGKLKPEILLIDTQGCEYEILEGAALALPTVQAVLFEWSKDKMYDGIKYYDDIAALLTKAGFRFHANRLCYQEIHGESVWVR